MARRMIVIAGPRSLDDDPERADWAREQIVDATRYLRAEDVVMAGGEPGPPTWAREFALYRRVKLVEFKTDGYRWRDGEKTPRRWNDLAKLGNGHVLPVHLARDVAMVQAGRLAVADGWDVRVLGLVDPRAQTQDAHALVTRAVQAGLPARALTYGTPDMCLEDHPGFVPGPVLITEETAPTEPDVLAIDTETSGLSPDTCCLLEIALIRLDPTVTYVRQQFEMKIAPYPGAVMEPQALRVNGYTRQAWAGAPDLDDVLAQIVAMGIMADAPRLLGHNVGFDRRFLTRAFERVRIPMPPLHRDNIDTQPMAKRLLRERPSPQRPRCENVKLSTVCTYFGITTEQSHRAMPDCARAVAAYQKLRELEQRDEQAALSFGVSA